MFKILTKLFGSTGGAVAEKIGGLVDKFVQTKDEKAQFEKEMELIFQEHELNLEREITSRHKADMASDSWLSKNIRPMVLIFLLVAYSGFAIASIFNYETRGAYVELLGQWGMLVMSFYFGGRTMEKLADKVAKK